MIRQSKLIKQIKAYNPKVDEEIIHRAYLFSMKAHESQIRESGDDYFSHPLEVASILANLKLDTPTIVTALLHDTVEDTLVTLEEIQELFGPEVKDLVDGVTKLSQIKFQSEKEKQAENFRKFFLALSNDIRVLLVKLADRLHNMRTLHFMKSEEKRLRIACETMDLYVPLAERIGISEMKEELEDLAFSVLNPEAQAAIRHRLQFLQVSEEASIEKIQQELKDLMARHQIKAHVNGRQKTPYSIWRKMTLKNVNFEQLFDIMAFRIIVPKKVDCYQVLGVLHSQYSVLPGYFKDYISTPKINGYQSLHTTLVGPLSQRIEIQIRTQEMHDIATHGVSAHWQYKQGYSHKGTQYEWVRRLLDILEHASEPLEFLEHTKLEMFKDEVFCFTPRGELITLPVGATAVDFAYALHSEIGDHAAGVKINGRQVPLKTVLHNGDQVEIVTSPHQKPSPSWERFVITGKAKARIRRFIRNTYREQFRELGRSILMKGFQKERKVIQEQSLLKVAKHFHYDYIDDLYAAVGRGIHTFKEVLEFVDSKEREKKEGEKKEKISLKEPNEKSPISIKGLIPGMAVHYGKCCHPVPGDRIVGNIMTGRGMTIHTQDCEIIKNFTDPERLLELSWDQNDAAQRYVARLRITFLNQKGGLADVTQSISQQAGNIVNLKILKRTVDFWDIFVDVEVKDTVHLDQMIAYLRGKKKIAFAERA